MSEEQLGWCCILTLGVSCVAYFLLDWWASRLTRDVPPGECVHFWRPYHGPGGGRQCRWCGERASDTN
jgi:hypothetical protein